MSRELTLEKERTKLEKYLKKNCRPELIKEINSMGVDQLKQKLQDQTIEKQKEITLKNNNEKLNSLKDQLREQNAVHNERIRLNDKISRFVALVLEDKGEG